jgi:deoxyribodipyrimidine photo-lyase
MAVLDVNPTVVGGCWRPAYDALQWDAAPELFAAWCAGQTGYPLVDAAMRQLVGSGFMHNRARMVVASFLTKDLGIDWRLGERFFARYLLDYDLAANNGGWQWAASTGCDAQPYFRIFNPVTQSEKFDATGDYIRQWVPELRRLPLRYLHAPWKTPPIEQAAAGVQIGTDYPLPVVDHAVARERTLARYAAVRDRR